MLNSQEYYVNTPQRLDQFLSEVLHQTRSQVVTLIKKGCVVVDTKLSTKPGMKLKVDQKVTVDFPDIQESIPLEIDFDVEILYEDEELLVINKPSGLTVHPAPSVKEATLVDWLKHKGIRLSTISGEERHGIVHRLDKGTSGAMVVAKTNEAHQFLSEQLQDKSMGRYYIAVITPPLKDDITEVELPIARSSANRLKMGYGNSNGKYAKTLFKQLALSDDEKIQLIACKLFTGRTHQIRVHLESLNRHILGDHLYATSPKVPKSERILLHAYELYFIHPKTEKKLIFQASFDTYMKEIIENKFSKEILDEVFAPQYITNSFAAYS